MHLGIKPITFWQRAPYAPSPHYHALLCIMPVEHSYHPAMWKILQNIVHMWNPFGNYSKYASQQCILFMQFVALWILFGDQPSCVFYYSGETLQEGFGLKCLPCLAFCRGVWLQRQVMTIGLWLSSGSSTASPSPGWMELNAPLKLLKKNWTEVNCIWHVCVPEAGCVINFPVFCYMY